MYSDHKSLHNLLVPLPEDVVLIMEALADTDSLVTVTSIRSATARDSVLSKVHELVIRGDHQAKFWVRSLSKTVEKPWKSIISAIEDTAGAKVKLLGLGETRAAVGRLGVRPASSARQVGLAGQISRN